MLAAVAVSTPTGPKTPLPTAVPTNNNKHNSLRATRVERTVRNRFKSSETFATSPWIHQVRWPGRTVPTGITMNKNHNIKSIMQTIFVAIFLDLLNLT